MRYSSSRQRPRRGEAALRLAAWRVAGVPVQLAQGFQDVIDADGRLSPSGARSAGQEAIAEASDAYDAKIARFSAERHH